MAWASLEDLAFQELGHVLLCVSWKSPFCAADRNRAGPGLSPVSSVTCARESLSLPEFGM